MSVLQIRDAQREGARMVIVLAGPTGCGKTRTALEIAYGLVGYDPSKIGFIDTENRRGSLKADVFQKDREKTSMVPFKIGDLIAPFSPDRHVEAVKEFQAEGVKVLIIDSFSHEWEGIGGCIDIAEEGNPNLPNWNKSKGKHKRLMNYILACDMHIILCLRAREKSKPEKQMVDGRMKTVYVDHGMEAICEKNVMFEATVSLMMSEAGKVQQIIKMEPELLSVLGRQKGYITDKDGEALANWINGAKQLDPEVEKHRNTLISVCEEGLAKLQTEWLDRTPKRVRLALGEGFLNTCKSSAMEYERAVREAAEQESELDALNTEFGKVEGDHRKPAESPKVETELKSDPPGAAESPKVDNQKPADNPPPASRRKASETPKSRPGNNPDAPSGEKPAAPANPPNKPKSVPAAETPKADKPKDAMNLF